MHVANRSAFEFLAFALVLEVAVSTTGRAHASGFASARFGGEHGNVTETNPTALYYNPGGIGLSEGARGLVDGTVAMRRVIWTHDLAPTDTPEPEGAVGANTGRAELFNVFGAPMWGASARLWDFSVGAAMYETFGGRVRWSKTYEYLDHPDFPLAAGGPQRWHSIRGDLVYLYSTLGLAFRFGGLRIGVTGNLILSSVNSFKAKNPTGMGDPDTSREGRVDVDVSGWQGSFGIGALFEVLPGSLWLGASYQAQPGLGPMRLEGELTLSYAGSSALFPVSFDQALPDITRVGARFRPSADWELRLFGDYTRWSVMTTQCVAVTGSPCVTDPSGADAGDGGVLLNLRRKWRDTVGIRASVSRWFSPGFEGFLGAGVETAAVPDSTLDPEVPDGNSIAGAAGVRLSLPGDWYLSPSYTHIHFLTRDNTGESELSDASLPTRRPDGGGVYKQWIGIFNVNVEKEF
jgi:long-chain fatty acid transport protein